LVEIIKWAGTIQ